jgi:hypothetical protein
MPVLAGWRLQQQTPAVCVALALPQVTTPGSESQTLLLLLLLLPH